MLVTYREAVESRPRVRYWIDGYGILPSYPTEWHLLTDSPVLVAHYGSRKCFEIELDSDLPRRPALDALLIP